MMATATEPESDAGVPSGHDADTHRPGRGWWPPAPWQVLALVIAVAFLAGVVGYQIGEPDASDPNDADIGFLDDMVSHHEQAVAMGFAFLEGGSDDWLLNHTAREIVRNQSVEMSIMSRLLLEFDGEATPETAMEWMGTPFPQSEMPGLASDEEFDRLKAARDREADDLFSRLMIRHHRAGAAMADAAAELAQTDEVREFASAVARVQRTEILELQARRQELGLTPVGGGASSTVESR